jgi:predicted MFS family arabinose efflux permease
MDAVGAPVATLSAWQRFLTNDADPDARWTQLTLIYLAVMADATLVVLPGLVGGMVDYRNFSYETAGSVVSYYMFGAGTASLVACLTQRHWHLRAVLVVALMFLGGASLLTGYVRDPGMMMAIQFLAGVGSGLIWGTISVAISAGNRSDRLFSVIICAEFAFAGVGIYFLPSVFGRFGFEGAYIALALLAGSGFFVLMLHPIKGYSEAAHPDAISRFPVWPVVLGFVGVLIFYLANNATWAFLDRIGIAAGLSIEKVSSSIAVSNIIAMFFSLIAGVCAVRFGRAWTFAAGFGVMAACTYLLIEIETSNEYLIASVLWTGAFAFVLPIVLSYFSSLDRSGRVVMLGVFSINAGLAAGPYLGGLLIGPDGDFTRMLLYAMAGFLLTLILMLMSLVSWRPDG